MNPRDNVVLQYSIATFIVAIAVAAVFGVTFSRAITDYQIRSHIRLYPEVVRLATKGHEDIYSELEQGETIHPATEELFRGFLMLGSVFRVKVWNRDGTIVWSDQKDLIGQRFADHDSLKIAMDGKVTYELGEANNTENLFEHDHGISLSIYTPLSDGKRVNGVLELYEADEDLFGQISKSTRFIWLMVIATGIVSYLLLFFIFYKSQKVQAKAKMQTAETQDVTIYALARLAELRDSETGKHLERTTNYVRILAEELSRHPSFKNYLTTRYINDVAKSAPLHDIGKVGVPDAILLKPGRLNDEERAIMQKHCEFGAKLLSSAEAKLKFQSFLTIAVQLTICHHERWDGAGYPQGLRGARIPISARLMAIADVYDALRTQRPYKDAFEHDVCARIIKGDRGKHFDPDCVDAFITRELDFRRVSEM